MHQDFEMFVTITLIGLALITVVISLIFVFVYYLPMKRHEADRDERFESDYQEKIRNVEEE